MTRRTEASSAFGEVIRMLRAYRCSLPPRMTRRTEASSAFEEVTRRAPQRFPLALRALHSGWVFALKRAGKNSSKRRGFLLL